MKHDQLRAIAHNISDSLSSGIGMMIGVYEIDIFSETKNNPEGTLIVDFLDGKVNGTIVSDSLKKVVTLYKDALPQLCKKHGAEWPCFNQLSAQYSISGGEKLVLVTMEDMKGKRSIDKYVGTPLKRPRFFTA